MTDQKITKKILRKTFEGVYQKKIIDLLSKKDSETVNNIADSIGVEQSYASIILTNLTTLGVLNRQVNGKYRSYSLDHERYQLIKNAYNQIEIFEKEKIDSILTQINPKQREPFIYAQKSALVTAKR
jgi:Mn-dependent DtxR family transcriptional regulator